MRKELLKYLGLDTFVVVDLETTGLDPENDRIIEVGAVKYVDGEEAGQYSSLINPKIEIPDFITRLTGISDNDVKEAPLIEQIIPELEKFLGENPVVGHQVNFDASFIEYYIRKQHNDFDGWASRIDRFKYFGRIRVDTLFLSRILLPFMPKLKLSYLSDTFGYTHDNAHRALDDAQATAKLFIDLVDRALALDNVIISQIIDLLFANSVRAKSFFVPLLKFKNENQVSVPALSMVDEVKNIQYHFNIIGEQEYKGTYSEDIDDYTLIDDENISDYFLEAGKLSRVIENYEVREEQQRMAERIGESVNNSRIIVAEAGTGTGKSMAYLTPMVEWSVANRMAGERTVVSTNTKNLQEQLFFKDIPTLFSARGGQFKTVLLKGRSNYLCLDKWHTIMTDMNQRLSQDERSRILPLVLWVKQTRTGDIAENNAFQLENNRGLWQKLIAEPSYCPGKACKYYDDCYLMKARDHARKADVVIVNHALLFSDIASDNSILGEFHNLVIDEAHNVEKTAAEYLGIRVSFWTFRNIYHRLYEDDPRKTGALLQLEFRLSKGNVNSKLRDELLQVSDRLKNNSQRLKQIITLFYGNFSRYIREQAKNRNNGISDAQKIRYFKNFRYFRDEEEQILTIRKTLTSLSKQLSEINEVLYDAGKDKFEFQDQIHRELLALEQDVHELINAFIFCLSADENHYVYWFEIPFNERNIDIPMYAVPLNISEILKTRLFDKMRSTVLTSATLSVDHSFEYFKQRTGLNLLEDREIVNDIYGSPFDYEKQLFLSVADFLPDPRNQEFPNAVARFLMSLHSAQKRGMMVLFTSYSLLNVVYNYLDNFCKENRVLLLAQGKSGSRSNIVLQFKENKGSILLGTDSFWEGVDIPGEALQVLIIPKLPFDVPSEPVIAARIKLSSC